MINFVNLVDTDTGKQVQFVDSRYYTKDMKKWYPGLTNILNVVSKGSQYESWLKSVGFNADALVRDAMDKGSRVHAAIQLLSNGEEISIGTAEKMNYSRDEWMMIARFVDFYTEFKPTILAVEKVLVSDKLEFGTQLDNVSLLGDELWYIDHKTGSLYDSASLQVAASIQLWNEYFPNTPIKRGGILHLDSNHRGRDPKKKSIQGEGWKLVEIEDLEKHWSDFKHIHAIWKRKNPDYKPFNLQYPATFKLELPKKEEPNQ